MLGNKHEPESQEAGESGHATVVVNAAATNTLNQSLIIALPAQNAGVCEHLTG